jgi:hypothetical protein
MINKIAFDYVPPDDIKYITIAHKKNLKTKTPPFLTYQFKEKDNSYVLG